MKYIKSVNTVLLTGKGNICLSVIIMAFKTDNQRKKVMANFKAIKKPIHTSKVPKNWIKGTTFRGVYNSEGGKQSSKLFENTAYLLEINYEVDNNDVHSHYVNIRNKSDPQGKWTATYFDNSKDAELYALQFMKTH